MFWYTVIGTIPAAVGGFLFHHKIEETLRGPKIIAVSMIGIALFMWLADSKSDLSRELPQANLGDAVTIGTAQAIALWPGVSRSGITIATALSRRFTREAATRFSFILSAPAIAGAVMFELPKLLKLHNANGLDLPLSTLALSVLVSGAAGYLVIAFFLRYLRTRTLKVFVVYRLLFGIIVLVWAFLHAGLR
jgi:undecaprenyl-diphosphatase